MDAAGRQCFWTIHVIGGQLPSSNDKLNAKKICGKRTERQLSAFTSRIGTLVMESTQ